MREFQVYIGGHIYTVYAVNPRQAYLRGRGLYLADYKWFHHLAISVSEHGKALHPLEWQSKRKQSNAPKK